MSKTLCLISNEQNSCFELHEMIRCFQPLSLINCAIYFQENRHSQSSSSKVDFYLLSSSPQTLWHFAFDLILIQGQFVDSYDPTIENSKYIQSMSQRMFNGKSHSCTRDSVISRLLLRLDIRTRLFIFNRSAYAN